VHARLFWLSERLHEEHEIDVGCLYSYNAALNDDALLVCLQLNEFELVLVLHLTHYFRMISEVAVALGI
jgi:hypothetical protein